MKKMFLTFTLMLLALTANAQSCPDGNHPHLINLGLPSGTKWACCNVDDDASNQSPTNYGSYYAWGEVNGKSVYNDVTYPYATGLDEDGDGFYDDWHDDTRVSGIWQNLGNCKGEDESGESIYDITGTKYDVAHVHWGGSWVMPSLEQIMELVDNCKYEWTTVNGVDGARFIGPNSHSIFLPAARYRWDVNLDDLDSSGYYWSSTQNPLISDNAYYLGFGSGYVDGYVTRRYAGQSVRPVAR